VRPARIVGEHQRDPTSDGRARSATCLPSIRRGEDMAVLSGGARMRQSSECRRSSSRTTSRRASADAMDTRTIGRVVRRMAPMPALPSDGAGAKRSRAGATAGWRRVHSRARMLATPRAQPAMDPAPGISDTP